MKYYEGLGQQHIHIQIFVSIQFLGNSNPYWQQNNLFDDLTPIHQQVATWTWSKFYANLEIDLSLCSLLGVFATEK